MKLSISVPLALFLISALPGCAIPKYNYTTQDISISEPQIGLPSTKGLGDVMLRQGKHKERDAIYVSNKIRVSWAYSLLPGYYLKQGEDDVGEYYYPGGEEPGHVDKVWIADPWKNVMTKMSRADVIVNPSICVVTMFNVSVCTPEFKEYYERRKQTLKNSDSFQQTLVYLGKAGDKVNIGYREFSGNMNEPTISNNIEHDLSKSLQFEYRGAKIEVIEANGQYVKYKVVESFRKGSD